MHSNAQEYWYDILWYNNGNLDIGEIYCDGRDAPRYLGSPGYYSSVAYDWGGGDSVSSYNNKIWATPAPYQTQTPYQVGDIDTIVEENCSAGVDCSGFISNVWELGTKEGTCSLYDYACYLSGVGDLNSGDIMIECNNHVVLYAYTGSTGVYAYESTTNHSFDRVMYDWEPWSRYNGYDMMRFNNSCNECP